MEKRVIVGAAAASLLIVPFAATVLLQQPGAPLIGLPAPGEKEAPKLESAPTVKPKAETGERLAAAPKKRDEPAGRIDGQISGGQVAQERKVKAPGNLALDVSREAAPSAVPATPPPAMKSLARRPRSDRAGPVRPAPAQANRDKFEARDANPVKSAVEHPVSTFSIDVDTASYAFVRRMLSQGRLPPKDAVRVEEMINYFGYDYPAPENAETPFRTSVALYPAPWNANTRLLHVGIKGYDIADAKRPPANLVFLIDVSGSMQSADKLPLLKSALRLLVSRLGDEDTISIVTYAGSAGTVLEPTPGTDKRKILAALDRLRSGGSTAGAQGIRQAYSLARAAFKKNGVNRIILASDGDFNVGITDRNELKSYVERQRKDGVSLSVLGFGQGNYNDALMQTLAQNGNGNAAYIDTLREAEKVLVQQSSGTLFTIAKDVKIQIEFNPARVSEYRLIGYETRRLKRADFNNDRVDAGEIGAGHTVTAIYEITPAGSAGGMIDALRYQRPAAAARGAAQSDEYAFLKLRYKLANETKSRLITIPVTEKMARDDIAGISADMRFAASVAAFGQKLRGSPQLADFSYGEIAKLAASSRGKDPFGYRGEFLSLVRLAEALDPAPAKE